MTTREQLIASLTETNTTPGWYPGNDDDARYIDWSHRDQDGAYTLEVGDEDAAVQLKLNQAELAELHRALTVTLLADAA